MGNKTRKNRGKHQQCITRTRPKHNNHPQQDPHRKEKLKIYYANLDNSIMSKFDELCLLISQKGYDFISLVEIKPKHGTLPQQSDMHIPGYDLFTSNLTASDTRGVCMYVKQSLNARQVQPPTTILFEDSVWTTIRGGNEDQLLVGCIYRSGTPARAIPRDKMLHQLLRWAADESPYTHKLIHGDFNHPIIKWDPTPTIQENIAPDHPDSKFAECIADTFLHQHISNPTRIRGSQTPTQDDLVFSNDTDMVQQLEHLDPLGGSDHVGIELMFLFEYTLQNENQVTLNWNKADFAKMKTLLSQDWTTLLADKTTQEAFDIFSSNITSAIEESVPTRVSNPTTKRFKPLWMNNAALKKAKKKYHAWIRYLNTKAGQDYTDYIAARNMSAQESRKARREFERKIAAESKTNNKAFWRYVNSKRKIRTKVGDLKTATGKYTNRDDEKAEILSKQYYDTFTKEDISILPAAINRIITTGPLADVQITEEEVHKKLVSLRIDKSPGPDGLHPRLLKELADELCQPLTTIFNLSITRTELPSQWREAVIIPIYKKGSRADPANYRPVSLTSIACKLLEKCLTERITQHITANELACPQQHGFTTGKSTTTNLLEALNIWTEALSHNIPIDIIFLDYAKAFDTVPHQRLIAKVKSQGIEGDMLGWIQQFLTNRKQCVKVNTSTSEWKPVISGVPQGTVLGPLLFSIFVSDMPDQVSSLISLFADDTKVYTHLLDNGQGQLTSNLQEDLNNLQKWAEKMQMRFHPDKCKSMHLGKNNPKRTYTIQTADGNTHNIKDTTEEKDLGVTIDDELTFSKHIQTQINKANAILGSLRHSFKYIDEASFTTLYKSLIRPHLEYATVIWAPHTKRLKDAIEQVQRRATRLVLGMTGLNYSERLKKLSLPTLDYRRQRADQLQIFKLAKKIDKITTDKPCLHCGKVMLQPSLATTTRGHQYKYQVQRAEGIRRHFLTTRTIEAWNKLQAETVTSPSVNAFKGRLAKDWKDHPDLYNYRFSY